MPSKIVVTKVSPCQSPIILKKEPKVFISSSKAIIDSKKKFTRFVFTWNNYPLDYKDKLMALHFRYICFGEEIAPTTGTKHIQGYIEFKQQLRMSEMQKLFKPLGVGFFEPAIGTREQNREYTSKSGFFFEHCNEKLEKKQGKRTDLDVVREMIDSGSTIADVHSCVTSYQSLKFAESYVKYSEKSRQPNDDFFVEWIYGPSGTGKSTSAVKTYPDAYLCMSTSKWWDGYDGHKTIIIDDFRSNFCTFSDLLKILQPLPFRVETKGSSRQLLANRIIITSCYSPFDVYTSITENKNQLYRRLNRVTYVSSYGVRHSIDLEVNKTAIEKENELKLFVDRGSTFANSSYDCLEHNFDNHSLSSSPLAPFDTD